MSEFRGYLCWEPAIVSRTVATEAVSPSDSVFLATHTPLKIRRRLRIDAAGSAETSIDESRLIKEFLGTPPKEGVLVAPVLGESGSGKSHLVRWAAANIKPGPNRHVIYLPKTHTSLRDVVTGLLLGRTGGVFDEIRAQMDRLGEGVSQDSLQRRILDELAEALTTATTSDPFAKPLVGGKGLAVLMHDNLFRDHMLRPGAFISRRAEHAIKGRGQDDTDVPLELTLEDLPLDIVNVAGLSIGEASAVAQKLFKQLVANTKIQEAAVRLLNENLDIAVMRAAHLGVGDIHRAFLELRKELVGQEMILLVEDFALIQGVRRDLLDAIIEAGVVKGVQEYATVRTLMAVTTGYYRQLDETFRTRAEASSPVYELDVRLTGDGSVSNDATIGFVAKYLNVARLGEENLRAAGNVVNACETCAFRDECHAGFGASAEGYGLYPYNGDAVIRAVAAAALDEHPDSFSPRAVLARAVRGVLIDQADDLAHGRFPGPAFNRDLPAKPGMKRLALQDRQSLEELFEGEELVRRINFLEFWGGSRGWINLAPSVHLALQIDALPDAPAPGPAPLPGPAPDPRTPSPSSPALRRDLAEVEAWANGEAMKQALARDLRNLIMNAVLARATWADPPMRHEGASGPVAKTYGNRNQFPRYVEIEGAPVNLPINFEPPISFKRTASNATFFQGILRASKGDFQGTRESLARLESIAEKHWRRFQETVVESRHLGESELVTAIRSQLVGAAMCGRVSEQASLAELIDATVWDGSGGARTDVAWRLPHWMDFEKRYRDQRAEVADVLKDALGASQGTGAIHALDVQRMARLIKAARKQEDTVTTPEWVANADRDLGRLMALIPMQLSDWETRIARIRVHVPDKSSFRETVEAVRAAAREGDSHGLVPVVLQEVAQRNDDAAALDFSTVVGLENRVRKAHEEGITQAALASLAGPDFGPDPARILDYLEWSSHWIDRGLATAGVATAFSDDEMDRQLGAVLAAWRSLGDKGPTDA